MAVPDTSNPALVTLDLTQYPIDTYISNQFASFGILFGGSDGGPFITDDSSSPTNPVLSGSPLFDGSIIATFVSPSDSSVPGMASDVSFEGGYFNSPNSTRVIWYDVKGKPISQQFNTKLGFQTFKHPGAIGGFKIEIVGDEPAGYEIQNISFVADPALELTDTNSGAVITSGDTAWITGDEPPLMPGLVAQILGADPSAQNAWHFNSHYSRRGSADDQDFSTSLSGTQQWIIPTETFYGGSAALEVTPGMGGGGKQAITFNIYGENPQTSVAQTYINANNGGFRFASAIAQAESLYDQFNTSGKLAGQPNFGKPAGWGMFQLDAEGLSRPITTAEVWNWVTNANSGLEVIANKQQAASAYFAAVQRTYPSQYQPPPATYTPPGTSTSLTYLEAATIQLYNSAAVVASLLTPSGKKHAYYLSCWKFYPNRPSGDRWEFVENPANPTYVIRVVNAYENPL